jgi:hypothetical protein
LPAYIGYASCRSIFIAPEASLEDGGPRLELSRGHEGARVHRIVAHSIDHARDEPSSRRVIARHGQRAALRVADGPPLFFELVVPDVVERSH